MVDETSRKLMKGSREFLHRVLANKKAAPAVRSAALGGKKIHFFFVENFEKKSYFVFI